jgi:hypothetical protein
MRDGFYAVARDGEHGRFVWPGLGWVTGLDAGRMLRSLARSSGAHRGKLPV